MKQYLILFLLLAATDVHTQFLFTVLPGPTYINVNGSFLTSGSPQACYADCQSCEIQTNVCEQCYIPYFSKTAQGSCQLNGGYTLESSLNEIVGGVGFTITGESWSNYKVVNCSAISSSGFFSDELIAIQPVNATLQLQYNRTLSLHNYVLIRFELITSSWSNTSSFAMNFYNQAGTSIIPQQNITFLPNVPMESLCSAGNNDQRFSVTVQIEDSNTTALSINMQAEDGSVSIATWAIISGLCDPTCSSCSYSSDPTACLGCNYFLEQISSGSCSQCPLGFVFVSGTYSFCQKCPIQYQTCSSVSSSCFYTDINTTLANNCSVVYNNSFYGQYYEINDQTFVGSLWTVNGLPSPSNYVPCGNQPLSSYTYVGQAQAGQPVTRIFVNLPQHLALSFSFNVFVVDVSAPTQTIQFQIYLNGDLYDVSYLTVTGMSNLCGGDALESFTTFPPTPFYVTNSATLNLTIVANSHWGIRNFRIVYEICDPLCLVCGSSGCQECQGFLGLQQGECSVCAVGLGLNTTDNVCVQCPESCLNCSLLSNGGISCLLCSEPFFQFQGVCTKRTNVGNTLTPPPLAPLSAQQNFSNCSLTLPSGNSNVSAMSFTLSNSTLESTFTISQPHYKKIVQFYLMRVGNWGQNDHVDVYLNDLLLLSRNYSTYGNKFCSAGNQTDYLTFQSIDFTDSNSTLTIYFQLVTVNGPKTFGVANLRVYPVGCQACLSFPFTYSIQYNYDDSLNVVVSFSRVYVNTNVTLFEEIFVLVLNGAALPYNVVSNNSVIYSLQAFPQGDTLQGTLRLECLYPELVTTDITDSVNDNGPFFSRLLVESYATSKVIDNIDSDTIVSRFTPVDDPTAVNGVRTFFQVMSRIVIYTGFAMFFLGLPTICTHFMHNLQKIWLHMFLAALAAPALLRQALTGFRQVQDQNIAISPSSWQSHLPLELYYSSQSYFYQYYTDVNFFRNIYNIGIAFLIFMVYLLVMHVVTKYCITRNMSNGSGVLRHLKITFHRRPYFFFNSVIFYQYLTLVLACTLQFTCLINTTDQGTFSGVSAAAAVVAFVLATIYPLFHFFYLRSRQQSLGNMKNIQFANRYHEIFFRFVRRDIWEQNGWIGIGVFIYNVYRYGEIWWYCVVVTVLAYSPQAQLYLLLITQALHMFVVLFSNLSRTGFFRLAKVLELGMFVGLEVILLACQSDQLTLTDRSYNTLGSVAIAIVFGIILVSFVRSCYTAWLLWREYGYRESGEKIHLRQGEMMRRDEYYASDEDMEPVEQVGTERV